MPTTTVEVDIKTVSATTTGASTGKQIVTMVFECDDTIDVANGWKANQKTGIELPSHAGPR